MSPFGWGRLPSEDSEWAEFVQRRLAHYATILFTISAGFFTVSAFIVALSSPMAALKLFTLPPCQAHLTATALMVVLWATTRFGRRTMPVLRAMDAGFTIVICFFFTGMFLGAPDGSRVELVLLLRCSQHLKAEPDAPSARLGAPLPKGLDEIVLSCLAKDPDERPRSAEALAQALRELGLPEWTGADSESWWATHRARVEAFRRKREQALAIETGETVAIDLTRRGDAAELAPNA